MNIDKVVFSFTKTTLFLLIIFGLILLGGNYLVEEFSKNLHLVTMEYIVGNTTENVVNDGLVARKGDWIYYRNYDSDKRIFKIRTDGSDKVRVNNDGFRAINVIDEWVYYQNDDVDGYLYKTLKDGRVTKQIE